MTQESTKVRFSIHSVTYSRFDSPGISARDVLRGNGKVRVQELLKFNAETFEEALERGQAQCSTLADALQKRKGNSGVMLTDYYFTVYDQNGKPTVYTEYGEKVSEGIPWWVFPLLPIVGIVVIVYLLIK